MDMQHRRRGFEPFIEKADSSKNLNMFFAESIGIFAGMITNREKIGKTSDELVAVWNADNPADLVE